MGRPKKKVRDIRIVGYVKPKYMEKILEMVNEGYYKSVSEIVTKGVIKFIDSYQKIDEGFTDKKDKVRKEAFRRKRKEEINSMLLEMAIEESESKEERKEAEAEGAYWKEQERKERENSIRRVMRTGMTRGEAKDFIKRIEEDLYLELITFDEAREAMKTGKLKGYKPKKKKKS